jgi:hypothetical protein
MKWLKMLLDSLVKTQKSFLCSAVFKFVIFVRFKWETIHKWKW